MNSKPKIFFIREKFPHMGPHSGYDLLFDNVEKQLLVKYKIVSFWKIEIITGRIINKIFLIIKPFLDYSIFYTINSFKTELTTLIYAVFLSPDIIQIAYIENNYGLGKWFKKLTKAKIIGTVHQPVSWWETQKEKAKYVRHLDILIVLDSKSKVYFSKYISADKIEIIRHGVDVDFFKPSVNENSKTEIRCVFAGQWLRDISLLYKIIEYINQKDNSILISFHLIYPLKDSNSNEIIDKISVQNNVNWYQGITDEELRDLYGSSHLFLIPLLDCTANNGILEAMSCGLPVVSTPVGGVFDYVRDDFAFLSNNYQEIGDYIIDIASKTELLKSKGVLARKYVEENLNWEVLSKEVINIY